MNIVAAVVAALLTSALCAATVALARWAKNATDERDHFQRVVESAHAQLTRNETDRALRTLGAAIEDDRREEL